MESCWTLGSLSDYLSRDTLAYSSLDRSRVLHVNTVEQLLPRPLDVVNFFLFIAEPLLQSRPTSMAEPPESSLPPPVLEKLRELNTELAEGEWFWLTDLEWTLHRLTANGKCNLSCWNLLRWLTGFEDIVQLALLFGSRKLERNAVLTSYAAYGEIAREIKKSLVIACFWNHS